MKDGPPANRPFRTNLEDSVPLSAYWKMGIILEPPLRNQLIRSEVRSEHFTWTKAVSNSKLAAAQFPGC